MMENIPPAVRTTLISSLADAGVPADMAREAVDLAAHAVDKAIDTVGNVAQAAATAAQMALTVQVAFQLLETVAKIHAEGSTIAARRIAESLGQKAREVRVEMKDEK